MSQFPTLQTDLPKRKNPAIVKTTDGTVLGYIPRGADVRTMSHLVAAVAPDGMVTRMTKPENAADVCYVYARVSDAKKHGVSIGSQQDDGVSRALAAGFRDENIRIIVENDRSADLEKERPGWLWAHQQMASGAATGLLTYRVDRYSRSLSEGNLGFDLIEHSGGRYITWGDGIDSIDPNAMDRARWGVQMAAHELSGIKSRQKNARKHTRAQGRYNGTIRTFGWMPVEEGRDGYRLRLRPATFEPYQWPPSNAWTDDEGNGREPVQTVPVTEADSSGQPVSEGQLLREARERVVTGESLSSVCRDFNRRDIKTVYGNQWRATSLKRCLVSPLTVGRAPLSDGSWVEDDEGNALVPNDPLFTLAEWVEVREALGLLSSSVSKARAPKAATLLAGSLVCGVCGNDRWEGGDPSKNSNASYRCRRDVEGACGKNYIKVASTDALVVSKVLLQASASADLATRDEVLGDDADAEQVASLKLERDNYMKLIEGGQVTEGSALVSITTRLATIDRKIGELEAQTVSFADDTAADLTADEWDEFSVAEQRRALTDVVKHVTILPSKRRDPENGKTGNDRIQITWR